jgi:hypothetical protein
MADERTYRFGDEVITAPTDLDPEEVRNVWQEIHPGLANATMETRDNGDIDFNVRAGTKG